MSSQCDALMIHSHRKEGVFILKRTSQEQKGKEAARCSSASVVPNTLSQGAFPPGSIDGGVLKQAGVSLFVSVLSERCEHNNRTLTRNQTTEANPNPTQQPEQIASICSAW